MLKTLKVRIGALPHKINFILQLVLRLLDLKKKKKYISQNKRRQPVGRRLREKRKESQPYLKHSFLLTFLFHL